MRRVKAVRLHAFGPPSVLRFEEIPVPPIRDDEILVRVHAAGVNPVDTKIRAGDFVRFHPALPAIIGRDVSGIVERTGAATTGFAAGDEVFGLLDYDRGAYAEYAIASVHELARKPAPLEHPVAGALPVAGLTAWQALFDYGRLRRGQRVLIHGGSGGVGHLAIQFAVWAGAEVATTCSARDVDHLHRLGAQTVIDYEAEPFQSHPQLHDLDLVLDLISGETREHSWPLLKRGGILVSTLPGPVPPQNRTDVSGREVVVSANAAQLTQIAHLVETGSVQVILDRTFPLANAAAAHAHLEDEHSIGKTVLVVGIADPRK